MKPTIKYRVYDSWGDFIVEGYAEECAKEIGITLKTFREVARKFKQGLYKKYSILEVLPEEKELWKSERELAKQWDDFVTPIRERYGVPVYKPGRDER